MAVPEGERRYRSSKRRCRAGRIVLETMVASCQSTYAIRTRFCFFTCHDRSSFRRFFLLLLSRLPLVALWPARVHSSCPADARGNGGTGYTTGQENSYVFRTEVTGPGAMWQRCRCVLVNDVSWVMVAWRKGRVCVFAVPRFRESRPFSRRQDKKRLGFLRFRVGMATRSGTVFCFLGIRWRSANPIQAAATYTGVEQSSSVQKFGSFS